MVFFLLMGDWRHSTPKFALGIAGVAMSKAYKSDNTIAEMTSWIKQPLHGFHKTEHTAQHLQAPEGPHTLELNVTKRQSCWPSDCPR